MQNSFSTKAKQIGGIILAVICVTVIILFLTKQQRNTKPTVSPHTHSKKQLDKFPDKTTLPSQRHLPLDRSQLKKMVASIREKNPADKELQTYLYKLVAGNIDDRVEAIQTLGISFNSDIEPLLLYLLKEAPEKELRAAAASALDNADNSPAAIKALVHALADPDEDVSDNALASLKAIRNHLVKKTLLAELKQDWMTPAVKDKVNLFIDQYYLKRDPFKNPLQ